MNIKRAVAIAGLALACAAAHAQTPGPRTAKSVYLEYLQVVREAQSLKQLYPYLSTSLAREFTDVMASLPADVQAQVEGRTIAILKSASMRPGSLPATPVVVEKSTDPGSVAELQVRFSTHTLKVEMVMERGTWRVSKEEIVQFSNPLPGPLGR